MKQNNTEKFYIQDLCFYYFIPLMLSGSIVNFIDGGSHYSSKWKVLYSEFQGRAINVVIFIFTLGLIYTFFISIPKLYNKSERIKAGVKLLFNSQFFYICIAMIPFLFFLKFYSFIYWYVFYIIYALICFYFQKQFNKKFISLMKS
jgi:hypothetical protein